MHSLRVLLCGHNTADLAAAAQFLSSRGSQAVVASQRASTLSLLKEGNFDVVVAEVSHSKEGDAVCALSLLGLAGAPPVAVAVDFQDSQSMVKAVELGACDVFPTPISKQQDRLSTLWQHALRRKGSTGSETSVLDSFKHLSSGSLQTAEQNDSSGWDASSSRRPATSKDQGDALFMAALVPSVFDADSECEDDRASVADQCSLRHAGMAAAGPALRMQLPTLQLAHHPYYESGPLSPERLALRSCSLPASEPPPPLLFEEGNGVCGLRRVLSDTMALSSCSLSDDERPGKKPKVEWTPELHERFVRAVELLGADKAVPSKIKEHMGEAARGLTRQNIASHLQKFRNRKRTRPAVPCGKLPLPPLLPAPTLGAHGAAVPTPYWAASTPYPGCIPACGVWPAPGQLVGTAAGPPFCSGAPPLLALASAEIHQLMREPSKLVPPIGLRLDTSAVMRQLAAAGAAKP